MHVKMPFNLFLLSRWYTVYESELMKHNCRCSLHISGEMMQVCSVYINAIAIPGGHAALILNCLVVGDVNDLWWPSGGMLLHLSNIEERIVHHFRLKRAYINVSIGLTDAICLDMMPILMQAILLDDQTALLDKSIDVLGLILHNIDAKR